MDNRNKFQEMLTDVLEVARVQGNRLGREEIKNLFGDMNLTESQYEHIFAYLAANQIKIDGYVEINSVYSKALQEEKQNEEESNLSYENDYHDEQDINHVINSKQNNKISNEEDSAYLKMYLEDLDAVRDYTLDEVMALIQKITEGDYFAKNRFVEINLRNVVEIANEYKNKGITLEDLIQEGNIGLLNSIEFLNELTDKSNWKEIVTKYVRSSIEAAIDEQKDSSNFEGKMIDKIKYINDAANELAEDLGREADINELAACTKLSVEEIQSILNLSVDAVKINKHNHSEENHSCCDHHHDHHHDHHNH